MSDYKMLICGLVALMIIIVIGSYLEDSNLKKFQLEQEKVKLEQMKIQLQMYQIKVS